MVVIIPAAGEGSRFLAQGYTDPKPLIEARGTPMIERVCRMFPFDRRIVICQGRYAGRIQEAAAGSEILPILKVTEGAAITVLCAEGQIADDDAVVICNSDNLIREGVSDFLLDAEHSDCAGAILTLRAASGPWSYVRVKGERITQVAEKTPISDYATAGVYYFRSWRMLRTAACKMVAANDRVNGEFYLAPVYNYMIGAGLYVRNFTIDRSRFVSLGTPEDLRSYNECT